MATCQPARGWPRRVHWQPAASPRCAAETCDRWLRPGAQVAPATNYSAECLVHDPSCVEMQVVPGSNGTSLGTLISDKVNMGAQRLRWYAQSRGQQQSDDGQASAALAPAATSSTARPHQHPEDRSATCDDPMIALSVATLRGRGQMCASGEGGRRPPQWLEVARTSDSHSLFGKVNGGRQREGHGDYGAP